MLVGIAKTLGLALFLGKGFDHTNPGNGIGQDVGDFAPHAVNFFKTGLQTVTHKVNHPTDKRQRDQGDQGQPRVHRKKYHSRHHNHHHIAGEVREVQGQIHRNAVTFAAHAREQITRAFSTEIFQRQAQQMLVRGGAQVGRNALRGQRQDISFRPTQAPSQKARA